jgi:hypothetical protein
MRYSEVLSENTYFIFNGVPSGVEDVVILMMLSLLFALDASSALLFTVLTHISSMHE